MEQPKTLTELRLSYAETRAKLTALQSTLPLVRAQAERRAIDAAAAKADPPLANGDKEKALGPNEKARERTLILALAEDADYCSHVAAMRALEGGLIRLEAEIEIARDARREREWQIRERLIDALDWHSVDRGDTPPTEGHEPAFDEVLDAVMDAMMDAHMDAIDAAHAQRENEEQAAQDSLNGLLDSLDDLLDGLDPEPVDAAGTALSEPPAQQELPPLDGDPLYESVRQATPGYSGEAVHRTDADQRTKALADYQAAIETADTESAVSCLLLDFEMDQRLDEPARAKLDELAKAKLAALREATRPAKGRR